MEIKAKGNNFEELLQSLKSQYEQSFFKIQFDYSHLSVWYKGKKVQIKEVKDLTTTILSFFKDKIITNRDFLDTKAIKVKIKFSIKKDCFVSFNDRFFLSDEYCFNSEVADEIIKLLNEIENKIELKKFMNWRRKKILLNERI